MDKKKLILKSKLVKLAILASVGTATIGLTGCSKKEENTVPSVAYVVVHGNDLPD